MHGKDRHRASAIAQVVELCSLPCDMRIYAYAQCLEWGVGNETRTHFLIWFCQLSKFSTAGRSFVETLCAYAVKYYCSFVIGEMAQEIDDILCKIDNTTFGECLSDMPYLVYYSRAPHPSGPLVLVYMV